MTTFRIHLADGRKVDVTAATPKDATAKVTGPILKIKRLKDTG